MTVPTQADVSEMDRLRKIMEGDLSADTAASPKVLPNGEKAFIFTKTHSREDVSEMEKILQNFNSVEKSATDTIKELLQETTKDRQLKEALITTKSDDGVIIGAWEISKFLREGLTKKQETVYHVKNVNTGERVKATFLILESAKSIVRFLNQGVDTDSPQIKQIADLEIQYRRLRARALTEKLSWHRAKKSNDEFKCDLCEAKFDAAKMQALYIKERIKNIYLST